MVAVVAVDFTVMPTTLAAHQSMVQFGGQSMPLVPMEVVVEEVPGAGLAAMAYRPRAMRAEAVPLVHMAVAVEEAEVFSVAAVDPVHLQLDKPLSVEQHLAMAQVVQVAVGMWVAYLQIYMVPKVVAEAVADILIFLDQLARSSVQWLMKAAISA